MTAVTPWAPAPATDRLRDLLIGACIDTDNNTPLDIELLGQIIWGAQDRRTLALLLHGIAVNVDDSEYLARLMRDVSLADRNMHRIGAREFCDWACDNYDADEPCPKCDACRDNPPAILDDAVSALLHLIVKHVGQARLDGVTG